MRVLQVLTTRNLGGVTTMIMNYNDIIDHEKVVIDVFVASDDLPNTFDDNIIKHGGIVFSAPSRKMRNFKKIKQEFSKTLSENKYDVIHLHSINSGFLFLKIAKKHGVKKIIMHSHNTKWAESRIKAIRNYFISKIGKKYITHYAACSKKAATALFGKKILNQDNYLFVENPVKVEKFFFDQEKRDTFRKQYDLESNFVIGSAARLCKQKNLVFAIDVFSEIVKLNSQAKLVLIGEGPERRAIEERIMRYNLTNSVIMLGRRTDVGDLINMFDCFVLPSLFEGLGISLLEAQCNGLKCFTSYGVPFEVQKGLCEFLPLKIGAKKWAEKIMEKSQTDIEERISSQKIQNLNEIANILTDWYLK